MITELLAFSVAVVIVFAGIACAIVRFTLTGKIFARVEHRTSIDKCNKALAQSGLKPLPQPEKPVTQKQVVPSAVKHTMA